MKRIAMAFAVVALAGRSSAQLAERPGGTTTFAGAKDVSGLSIKMPRCRLVHSTDGSVPGTTGWLQRNDPFLLWKLGKDLSQREMQLQQGVFAAGTSHDVAVARELLADGVTPAMTGSDQVSCGGCHASPYRDAGSGSNVASRSGLGRNTPHFFGAGLLEMLGFQTRQKILEQADTNRNGRIDREELSGRRLLVAPAPGAAPVDFGVTADLDGDGRPDLDSICRVWFVDAGGRYLPSATSLASPGVAGYDFILDVFGWGASGGGGLNPSCRDFGWAPFDGHSGLQAHDPTTTTDPDGDGWGQVSNTGFRQAWVGRIPPDAGMRRNSVGLSLDDPDGDGIASELTEGDVDAVEWYVAGSPRPGRGPSTRRTRRGEALFARMGCAGCHVPDWKVEASDPTNADPHRRYLGDLRFFDLDVAWNDSTGRLEGRLVRLGHTDPATGLFVPSHASFLVRGLYSDLRQHDLGEDFAERRYDGSVHERFRTTPLWGNGGSGYPWGHDGRSTTLDDVIRRHGGEAAASRRQYVTADVEEQEALVAFLRTLVLYPTDQVPADVDGDGVIAEHFLVAGRDTGVERFNPEWLFRNPGTIEGPATGSDGKPIRSDALTNVELAYGAPLPGILDTDHDGFPDVIDECPTTPGVGDGCHAAVPPAAAPARPEVTR